MSSYSSPASNSSSPPQSPPPTSQYSSPSYNYSTSPPPSPPKSPPPSYSASPPPTSNSPPPTSSPPPPAYQPSQNATSPPPNGNSSSESPPPQYQSPPSNSSSPPPPLPPPTPRLTPSPPQTNTPATNTPPGSAQLPPPAHLSQPPPPPHSQWSPPHLPPHSPQSNSSGAKPHHNSSLSHPPHETSESTVHGLNTRSNGIMFGVAIGVVAGILALSIVIVAVWFVRRRKRKWTGSGGKYATPTPFGSSQRLDKFFFGRHNSAHLARKASEGKFIHEPGGVGNSKCFTYEELSEATNGFSAKNLLGEGGFGYVYKGILVDGREVAVKLQKVDGGQGEREFRAEVEIISRVHHRYLVSLVGYCISNNQRMLVYVYVPNNSLHYHLHGEGRPVMDWVTRVKVAAGAAHGIAYLHEDCHPRIIHRDIKSANILLDNNFEARVADFGLAKLALDANTHVSTRVVGTFGYMAPEYALSGKLTEKSDVFSFGVVLLELITGRKPVDTSLGEQSLVEWARPLLLRALDDQDFEELVDPCLQENFIEEELLLMIEAAASCVRHSSAKRPRMSQVVRALYSLSQLSDLTNGMKPGQSENFDPKQQSAEIRMFRKMAFGSQDWSTDFFNESKKNWKS